MNGTDMSTGQTLLSYEIAIDPCPKPRMTKRDTFDPRGIVKKYWSFKKEFVLKCKKEGLKDLPQVIGVRFILPMAKSWSKKKKTLNDGSPHMSVPDLDNLMKGLKDALASNDEHVHRYLFASKEWGREGKIIIFTPKEEEDAH